MPPIDGEQASLLALAATAVTPGISMERDALLVLAGGLLAILVVAARAGGKCRVAPVAAWTWFRSLPPEMPVPERAAGTAGAIRNNGSIGR